MLSDGEEVCSIGLIAPVFGGLSYGWKVVDAGRKLEELMECDLVLSDHPEETT